MRLSFNHTSIPVIADAVFGTVVLSDVIRYWYKAWQAYDLAW